MSKLTDKIKLSGGILLGMLCMLAGILAGCAPEASGDFYSLQEAYEAGYLTKEEIMSIAYYHNGGRVYNEEIMSEEYTPIPKRNVKKIRSTAAHGYNERFPDQNAAADDFSINKYCGTYGDCVVVMMTDIYSNYTDAEWFGEVAGVRFYYNNGNSLSIWKEWE